MSAAALVLLTLQIIFGALDNILHHEVTERLPSRPSARRELALHSARESIYAVLFLVFAWVEPSGMFAIGVLALLAAEIGITIADFIEEDRSRHLPPFERVLHTVLALMYGGFLIAVVPWLAAKAAIASDVVLVSYGLLSWFFTLASIGVLGFAIRDAMAVRQLGKARLPIQNVPPSGRSVLVSGGTGFIGAAVVERLRSRGDRVLVLTRDTRLSRAVFGTHVVHVSSLSNLPRETRVDAVVNLAGAPVIGLPWTRGRRKAIWKSRIELTDALVEWIKGLDRAPRVLVSGSAIGYYGDRGDEILDEAATLGSGFAAELCSAWEVSARRARDLGTRVVCLRIGLVLDRSGGALPMMTMPVRLAMGALFGRGLQWMGWITRDDLARMIVSAIDIDAWQGAINAVAPEPLRHIDFQKALARTLRRPLYLSVPAWLLKCVMGEMSSVFLFSQRVIPRQALQLGFEFDVHWAADALKLQLTPIADEFPVIKDQLQSKGTIAETAARCPSLDGAIDDNHDLWRPLVPVCSQGAGSVGREEARV